MKKIGMACLACLLTASAVWGAGSQEAQSEKTRLILWDQYYRGVESTIMDGLVQEFEAENPDIDIVRETKTLDDLKLVLKMSVESGTGPDIMQLNQGEADMGAFVKAGLIVNMNETAAKEHWEEIFSEATLKAMGYQGDYYGIATTAEVVGFFYNKKLFKQLGFSIPKTFKELEDILAATKKAGYTPINFGNLDGWTGIHEFSALQHVFTTRTELDDMMSGKTGNYWTADANRKAATKLQEWVKAGYFTKDFSGIGYDDSANMFFMGDSLFMLTGNWLMGEMLENAPFEVGFFLFPADDAAHLKAIGGPGIPFVISSKSEHPEEATKFLNFLASKQTAKAWADQMMLPAQTVSASDYQDSPQLYQDILRAYNDINKINGMGYYIDWITPTFYDTCAAAVQQLTALEITPQEFVEKLQADYNSYYPAK